MTVLLKIIAVWAGLTGLVYAAIAWTITSPAILLSGGFIGLLMFVLEWSISVAGLLGAVQLWRLRERGRRAVMGLSVLTFFVLVIGAALGLHIGYGNLNYGINVVVLCVLLSKRARALCATTPVPMPQIANLG